MASIKKQSTKQKQDQFLLIMKSYGLSSPQAIKERILWKHIKMIVINLFGETEENKKLMEVHDFHWRLAEQQENKSKLKS